MSALKDFPKITAKLIAAKALVEACWSGTTPGAGGGPYITDGRIMMLRGGVGSEWRRAIEENEMFNTSKVLEPNRAVRAFDEWVAAAEGKAAAELCGVHQRGDGAPSMQVGLAQLAPDRLALVILATGADSVVVVAEAAPAVFYRDGKAVAVLMPLIPEGAVE